MDIKKMTGFRPGPGFRLLAAVCLAIALAPRIAQPKEKPGASPYVILSEEFFTAMQKLAQSGMTHGDRQELLLEQIALSGQYVVKTNLTLIQQNEKIIRLLEELNRKCLTTER